MSLSIYRADSPAGVVRDFIEREDGSIQYLVDTQDGVRDFYYADWDEVIMVYGFDPRVSDVFEKVE